MFLFLFFLNIIFLFPFISSDFFGNILLAFVCDCNGKDYAYRGCCFISLRLDQSCLLFGHEFYVIFFGRDEGVSQSSPAV